MKAVTDKQGRSIELHNGDRMTIIDETPDAVIVKIERLAQRRKFHRFFRLLVRAWKLRVPSTR